MVTPPPTCHVTGPPGGVKKIRKTQNATMENVGAYADVCYADADVCYTDADVYSRKTHNADTTANSLYTLLAADMLYQLLTCFTSACHAILTGGTESRTTHTAPYADVC
jgi:hypothetical protein